MSLKIVFPWMIAAQAVALLALALLAGLALSGSKAALEAHMAVGGATILLSIIQAVAALLLRRSGQIPRWPVVASVGFVIGDAVQMAAGRLQLFALHLPLGVGLFGAAIGLAIYARRRQSRNVVTAGIRAGRFAVDGLPMKEE